MRVVEESPRKDVIVPMRKYLRSKVPHAVKVRLLLIVLIGGFYLLAYEPDVARSDELPIVRQAMIANSRGNAQQPTATPQQPTATPQAPDVEALAQEVELLKIKVESGLESMSSASDRIINLFTVITAVITGVGAFLGIATWYGGKQEQDRRQRMFALQATNLGEVNKITTAIAEGAEQNVNSLNTILSTFQRIMDFKVAEAENIRELMQQMQMIQRQFEELREAQRQQVEELWRSAARLRRSRFEYTNPDQELKRQLEEFRMQMDPLPRAILDRYAGVETPAEHRHYGEIYLRRGVIAYYDNDVLKSREMLRIAEQFFPFLEQAIESMPRDQKIPIAFTQYYLALIEKNYGEMTAARDYIEKSYAVFGRGEPEEILTPTTRAEILSYLPDMGIARAAIQEVLHRAANRALTKALTQHDAIYANRARLLLGNTYYVEGKWEQALQCYEDALEKDGQQDYSYYAYYSIAQAHRQLGNKEEAKKSKRQAYEALVATKHLQTKVALDTRILLNALAYLCTREEEPEQAEKYKETIRELRDRIHVVDGLHLRLFSFEKKRPVSKDEFVDEVLAANT